MACPYAFPQGEHASPVWGFTTKQYSITKIGMTKLRKSEITHHDNIIIRYNILSLVYINIVLLILHHKYT